MVPRLWVDRPDEAARLVVGFSVFDADFLSAIQPCSRPVAPSPARVYGIQLGVPEVGRLGPRKQIRERLGEGGDATQHSTADVAQQTKKLSPVAREPPSSVSGGEE